jgi:DNA-nicking Smr family endonuclease
MWRRVKASARPLKAKLATPVKPPVSLPEAPAKAVAKLAQRPAAIPAVAPASKGRVPKIPAAKASPPKPAAPIGSAPIDKSWERDFRSGRIDIDLTVDLHGHYLAGAHTALSRALDRATAMGARVVLVIAGKSRGPDEAPRGAIRRELATWLAHSHHSSRILAVRNAHPRHGGAGALYVVLRKAERA